MKALHYALAAVVATAFGAAQASLPGAPLDPNPTYGSTVAVPLDQNGAGNGNVPVQRIEPPAVPPVPNVPLEPELTHDVALRALLVTGDPGCGFVLVAGFDPAPFAWFPGVHNTLDAVAIVQIGFLDMLGRAYVPFDDQLQVPGEDSILFQAIVCSVGATNGLDIRLSNVVKVALRPFDITVPAFLPKEDLWIAPNATGLEAKAMFACICGWPPQVAVDLAVEMPSDAHLLWLDRVENAGAFTRVTVAVGYPPDDKVIPGPTVVRHLLVPLGVWVGKVEVVLEANELD
ncbi:MAG: hypothetical protein O2865_01335 [Planctomycetota bacterium]|nr:hypothetical protein [Planctomycetota bacterium]MDA0933458.1 hypothetical protein [Planctomycetota bacterium]